jgi:hypothetical protein
MPLFESDPIQYVFGFLIGVFGYSMGLHVVLNNLLKEVQKLATKTETE